MLTLNRSVVAWLLLLCSLGAPASAQVVTREFFIDPAQSFVQIDPTSQFVLALPAPLGTLAVPLVAQTDPSVSGLVLPGIGQSDGTSTALAGGFYLTLALPVPGFNGSLAGGEASQLFEVMDSGSWLPGDAVGPLPGQLAVEAGFPSIGVGAELVLRDLAFGGFDGDELVYVSDNEFTFPAQPLFLDPTIRAPAVTGAVWARGFGFRGAILVPEGSGAFVVPANSGTITRFGPDDFQLDIAFATELDVAPSAPFAGGVELDLSGRIVARTVPEPRLGLAMGAGLVMLLLLADRKRRPSAGSPRWLVYLMAALILGPACLDPQAFNEDENGDGVLDSAEISTFKSGEGDGSTATAQLDTVSLEIQESGQAPVSSSCSAGTGGCTLTETLSTGSGCGAIEQRAEPKGVRVDLSDTCSGSTQYSAVASARQAAFNFAGIPKTFLVRSRVDASDPAGLGVLISVNGQPLLPGATLEVVVPAFASLDITILSDLTYTADGAGDEWASLMIEVVTPDVLCDNNVECGPGAACLPNGLCTPSAPNSFCTSHSDCPSDLYCVEPFSRCRALSLYPDSCTYDWSCEGKCISFLCSEGLEFHPCNVDEDCDVSAPVCAGGFCSTAE